MNWGRNARKNIATFGFRRFTTTPWRKRWAWDRGARTAGSSSPAWRSFWIPSQTRYAAPANFTTLNASAEEARIADTPIAAAKTWISAPAWTPSIDATPARRPCAMLVPTM